MDPMKVSNLLPELRDWILQFLDVRSFLELTKVSPGWNEALGKSLMMKKVKIQIGSAIGLTDNKSIEMENVMDRSCKHYRNANFILAVVHSSKKNSSKMMKYLVALSPTLQELNFQNLHDLSNEDERILDHLDFSVLKVLKMTLVSSKVAEKLMSPCNSLSKLEFKLNGLQASDVLRSFLERNQSLREIIVDEIDYRAFFAEDISEITRFNLKVLKASSWSDLSSTPEDIEKNLLKFLTKQSQSLEEIQIKACSLNVTEHLFNKIPALKSLGIPMHDVRDLKLNLNENITDLSIPNDISLRDMEKILKIMPNLTKLVVKRITQEIIIVIKRNLPELQSLLFEAFDLEDDGPVWAPLWPSKYPKYVLHFSHLSLWLLEK